MRTRRALDFFADRWATHLRAFRLAGEAFEVRFARASSRAGIAVLGLALALFAARVGDESVVLAAAVFVSEAVFVFGDFARGDFLSLDFEATGFALRLVLAIEDFRLLLALATDFLLLTFFPATVALLFFVTALFAIVFFVADFFAIDFFAVLPRAIVFFAFTWRVARAAAGALEAAVLTSLESEGALRAAPGCKSLKYSPMA